MVCIHYTEYRIQKAAPVSELMHSFHLVSFHSSLYFITNFHIDPDSHQKTLRISISVNLIAAQKRVIKKMRQRVLAVSRNRRRRRRRHRRRRRRHRRYRRGTNEPKFYYFVHVISTHFKRKRREICVSD